MKFTSRGIQILEYEGDTLYWLWPWVKIGFPRFWSNTYEICFPTIPEYIIRKRELDIIYGIVEVDKKILYLTGGGKIMGFTTDEILESWASRFDKGIFVVLHDLDLSRRPQTFWAQIPPKHRIELAKDVVVMNCRDMNVAADIISSLEDGFGKAFIVKDGKIVRENDE